MSDVKNKESRRRIVNKTLYKENPDLAALESCNAWCEALYFALRSKINLLKYIKIIGILKSLANTSYLAK